MESPSGEEVLLYVASPGARGHGEDQRSPGPGPALRPQLGNRSAISLLRVRKGSIVLMASTRAIQSEPQCEAYAAAKGALLALNHALAISLGPDIRCNAILPGWIETGPWAKPSARKAAEHRDVDREQHPVGRVGEPRDIAATVAFLASEGAAFITGQQIAVDGGMTRKMIYAH